MTGTVEIFHIVMIKPTHYDDHGYPIQWVRSQMPSNTLAALFGILEDCRERQVLGPDVDIRVQAFDETSARIHPGRIIRDIRGAGGRALIAFVGVQTNQFPRAVDLAQPFLAVGVPVAIGGFHVSGCLSMLPDLPPELRSAQEVGISLFAGEAEDRRLDEVLRDAFDGALKPLYDHMNVLPDMQGQPRPFLPVGTIRLTQANWSSFDLGRGCPYQCSFCTIINVQGRKSRFRSADDLEAIVRRNAEQGVKSFFVTDDDLARNRNWEAFFDRLIHLRENEDLPVKLTIQVDTQCHKIDGFIDKACRAGVERVFIGLENINPDNLVGAGKRQNKITDYRTMLQKWREYGTTILAGYILGFPGDSRESILRDIGIVQRELPIDILEFFILTPLPGSEDHRRLAAAEVLMDPDLNKYDVCHSVTHHANMSGDELQQIYHDAWFAYYTPEHIETIGRRSAAQKAKGVNLDEVVEFFLAYKVENVHPLEGGIFRRKYRRDRRPGLPPENPVLFYTRYGFETARKMAQFATGLWTAKRLHKRIFSDPNRFDYSDVATTPPEAADAEKLELFQETSGAKAALKRDRVIAEAGKKAMAAGE